MTDLASLDTRAAEYWTPRHDPLSNLAFARTLTVPDSEDENGHPEPYDPSSHPGQPHWLRALDGEYDRPGSRFLVFVLIGDAQGAGKSWMMQQAAFRDLIETGASVIYALPTRDLAGDVWSLKLRPAIIGAGLEKYLPTGGAGAKGGSKPRFVNFRRVDSKGGGTMVFMGAGGRGQSGQAALTAKKLVVDEVEDWSVSALRLIKNRVSKNNQTALQLYACTINKNNNPDREDDESRIIPLYERSTRGRIEYPCPHCSKFTRLEPESFKYEGTTREEWIASAQVACVQCGTVITDAQRMEMHGNSRLVMDEPLATSFGLRLTALDCPWKPLHWLAEMHHGALLSIDAGDHEPMRQMFNKEWSAQYSGDRDSEGNAEKITPKGLMRRSEASTWGPSEMTTNRRAGEDQAPRTYVRHIAPLPDAAEWVIPTIDVQGDRVYWFLGAGARDGQTWDVAWGYEYADFTMSEMDQLQLWSVLARVDGLTREIAGDLPFPYRGVDANYNTDWVIAWLAQHHEWWPLYGASAQKAAKLKGKEGERVEDAPGILYLRRSEGWRLRQPRCHVDTTPMRLAAQRTHLLKPGDPHSAHLPNGLKNNSSDRMYLQHLCAEQWNEKKMKWEQPGGRWDLLDTRTYFMSLHRYHLLKVTRPKTAPKRKYGAITSIGGRQ